MNKTLAASLFALFSLSSLAACSDGPIEEDSSYSVSEGSPEATAILALVNDPVIGLDELDDDAKLNSLAASNIIKHRAAGDGQLNTSDDDLFDDLAELDAVPQVGPSALKALLAYAIERGYMPAGQAEVIFSPQLLAESHNARIADLIDGAQENVDIAMYSYSSAAIAAALEDAVARGVDVRFIFETANGKDKKLGGIDLQDSKSGRLEAAGVDVRYVNKIMHHKFVIVDGPRHNLGAAGSSRIASGSANWSTGGATIYDENTVFLSSVPEMAIKLQRQFDHMWTHSSDLVANASLTTSNSSVEILDSDINDNPDLDVYFTSANFDVADDSTVFRLRSREDMAVSDKWVEAIEGATDSIWVATGHMRLRPVAEALIAKKQADPSVDIRVYVDQQEYISFTGNNSQIEKREDCLQNATTANKIFDCENKSFLWAKAVGDAGIDVRYKFYAYRWHFSYAEQMHNKFMIVDDDELYTGSYNLSVNAEHSTFENLMHFKAPTFSGLVQSYAGYFDDVYETGRSGSELEDLRNVIETAANIPLVFESMSLTYQEATSLKALIRDNCADVNSTEFRQNPASHKLCPR